MGKQVKGEGEERRGRGGGDGGGIVHLIQNSRGCPPNSKSRKKSALYWGKKTPWLCMEKPTTTT